MEHPERKDPIPGISPVKIINWIAWIIAKRLPTPSIKNCKGQ